MDALALAKVHWQQLQRGFVFRRVVLERPLRSSQTSSLTTTAHFFEVHFEVLVEQGLSFHLWETLTLLLALLMASLLVLKDPLLLHQVSLHPPSRALFALLFFLLLQSKGQGVRKALAP